MATSVQTSYAADPGIGYAGQLADCGPHHIITKANNNATTLAAGLIALRSGDSTCRPILSSDEPVADPDAIIASGVATATTRQVISGASLNGAIGAAVISPPKNVTLTFNSSGDWNDTTLVVQGKDYAGNPIEETFLVKEGGNEVVTGVKHFAYVTAVIVPPGTSTGGTLLVGTGASIGPINAMVAGLSIYDATREPEAYQQYEDAPLGRKGRFVVDAEAAVTENDPVFVRFVATGNEVRGALRGSSDSNDCGLLLGARWTTSVTAAGKAVVEIDLP